MIMRSISTMVVLLALLAVSTKGNAEENDLRKQMEIQQQQINQLLKQNELMQKKIEALEASNREIQALQAEVGRLRSALGAEEKAEEVPPKEAKPVIERLSDTEEKVAETHQKLTDLLSNQVSERLSIYGYADVTFGYNRYESGTSGFDMYHWQTFFDYRLTEKMDFIGDLTFEHGPEHTGKNLGDIKTRAYFKTSVRDWFKLNVGKFLTPFGIQNLYHDAAVAYTSVTSPRSIYWKRAIGESADGEKTTDRFFAKEAAGIWFYGNIPLDALEFESLEDWDLEYNFYVVNGRGTGNPFQVDSNQDKGLGTKMVFGTPYGLSFGYSFYGDKDTRLLDSDTRHFTNAGQLTYAYENLKIFGEYAYADYGKDGAGEGYYGELDYTFFGRYTPYYRYDHYNDRTVKNLEGDETIHTLGLNYMIRPNIFFKVEYGFEEGEDDVFQAQISAGY